MGGTDTKPQMWAELAEFSMIYYHPVFNVCVCVFFWSVHIWTGPPRVYQVTEWGKHQAVRIQFLSWCDDRVIRIGQPPLHESTRPSQQRFSNGLLCFIFSNTVASYGSCEFVHANASHQTRNEHWHHNRSVRLKVWQFCAVFNFLGNKYWLIASS